MDKEIRQMDEAEDVGYEEMLDLYRKMSITDLSARWERILDRFDKEIQDAIITGQTSILLDFQKLDMIDPVMMELFIEKPYTVLYVLDKVIRDITEGEEHQIRSARIYNLPEWATVQIRDLRASHLGKIVCIKGLVRKATEVRPKIENAYFQCNKCGAVFSYPQKGQTLEEPYECPTDQGGCGRHTSFTLLTEDSVFVDSQKIEVQENPEGLFGGEQPQKISVYLEGDLVAKVFPGDEVTIIGIVNGKQRWTKGGKQSTEFGMVIDAHNIIPNIRAFEEVKILDEDIEKIKELSKDPQIHEKIRNSIAPTIYGMEKEKDALALQLFGGVPKVMPDGTKIRGDIHVLFVGEPGTGKSQLLKRVKDIAPRSVFTSGKGSSAVGLTASAVRDDFGEGRWTLEAGALVLADQGLAIVDELDKMRAQDRDALHEAMEQQEINIAKAGINATLKSRCSLLAAANPKFGRYDPYGVIADQINLPPPLISRFDLIFPIIDKINQERDRKLSSHILKSHRVGQILHYNEVRNDNISIDNEDMDLLTPEIDRVLLRKYIAYAKREVCPIMTEEAMKKLEDFYVDMRKQGIDSSSIPITARQIEGMIRMAEASAKIRLSNEVTEEDAQRAIDLLMYCLSKIGFDADTNTFDIDMVATGVKRSQADKMRIIKRIIEEGMEESEDELVSLEYIAEKAKEKLDMEFEEVEHLIEKMTTDGILCEPKYKHFQPT